MTLRECLAGFEKGTFFYISAGNSFIYIGANPLEELPKADDAYIEREMRYVRRAKISLNSAKKREKKYQTMLDKGEFSYFVSAKDVTRHRNNAKKEQKSLPEYIKKKLDRIEKRTPFLDREVKEVYDRRWVEPLGKIIKIKGTEVGAYWLYSEWLAKPFVAPERTAFQSDGV